MITSKMRNCPILLVDDEPAELEAYSLLLTSMGMKNIRTLSDSRNVLATLESMQSPVLFLDLNMPHMSGQEVLRELKVKKPQIPVIIVTADSEIETAVECLKTWRAGLSCQTNRPEDVQLCPAQCLGNWFAAQ